MINPNKSYRAKPLARITKIDGPNAYFPYVYIETLDDKRKFEGNLVQCHSQWQQLKVGDVVGLTCWFSIVADKFMVDTLIRKRK